VLEQRGDASKADPNALEPEVTVKVFLPEDQDTVGLRRKIEESLYHLGRLYPIPAPQFRKLVEEDWANAWRKHYQPFRVGKRLWIRPSWMKAEDSEPGDIVIAMDPGMAFGTGLHPSTQMCLQQLEALVEPGMKIMDVGTGSGILSTAAAKLGAHRVLAFDTDRLAVEAAKENAMRNRVADRLLLFQGELAALIPAGWDVVVVNILAPVIVDLLSRARLADYAGRDGRLILSGIIEEQENSVLTALTNVSMILTDKLIVRDWVCLVAKKA
jgi:ribosomal protein L11 methyltransferase